MSEWVAVTAPVLYFITAVGRFYDNSQFAFKGTAAMGAIAWITASALNSSWVQLAAACTYLVAACIRMRNNEYISSFASLAGAIVWGVSAILTGPWNSTAQQLTQFAAACFYAAASVLRLADLTDPAALLACAGSLWWIVSLAV